MAPMINPDIVFIENLSLLQRDCDVSRSTLDGFENIENLSLLQRDCDEMA